MKTMEVGEFSEVVEDGGAFHIFKVVRNKPSRDMTINEANRILEDRLAAYSQEKRRVAWMEELKKDAKINIDEEKLKEMLGAPARRKAPVALLILVGMLVLLVTNALSVAAASLLAGLAMILTGCLTIDDAYAAVDWKRIVLIAGMLPMSTALEKVGLVELAAAGLTDVLGGMSPIVVMASLFLISNRDGSSANSFSK